MLIKEPRNKNIFTELNRNKIKKIILGIFLILYSLILFISGAAVYRARTWHLLLEPSLITAFNRIDTPKNFFRGLSARPEHIAININHMDYQKLAYQRKIAIARNMLVTNPEDYVPATIQYENRNIRADIRLKGDNVPHLRSRDDKWSFRIKIKGDDALFGMKKFSIQHPGTRNYIYEWIYHQTLKMDGIPSLRYKFIRVAINGKDKGIYALEEHFDKILIENNRNREGPILKFNEEIPWGDISIHGLESPSGLQSVFSLDIDAFKMNTISRKPEIYKEYIAGKDLLESFRMGLLPAHKVFDSKKLAKYFAISELTGGLHGAGREKYGNWRFYYNPITSLLEPIGFDAVAGQDLKKTWIKDAVRVIEEPPNSYHGLIFSDMVFFEEYMKALEYVSRTEYLDNLFKEIGPDLQKNLNIIYSQYPHYVFSKDILYRNQEFIRKLLNPFKCIHAYYIKGQKEGIELALLNIQSLPVEVLSLTYKDYTFLPETKKFILKPRVPSKLMDYKTIFFLTDENFIFQDAMVSDLKIKYRLLGTTSVRYESVFPYPNISDDFLKNDFVRQPPNAEDFKFLSIDESAKKIFILPGNWDLDQNLIIPKGYKVICAGGVQLNISNSAKILSFSPMELTGSEDSPIVISSEDKTGQGIIVIGADLRSRIEHVVFRNLSNPRHAWWQITGAVTFYESPVDIKSCQFLNNESEDSLNIIRSDFYIDKTLFSDTSRDAFDSDFCTGEITNSSFINCGNDGIDISGSIINLESIFIDGAGDKGISVGEDSKMNANNITIKNANIAFASKDISELTINKSDVSICKIGLAVYQKKSEFGPGSIVADGLKMKNIDTPHILEWNSHLELNGEKIKSDRKNVYTEVISKIAEI